MKTNFETVIYKLIPHWDAIELEVPVICEIETYKGSNETDDPCEVNCMSCIVTETVNFENRVEFLKGQKLELDDHERNQIAENFITHKNNECNDD